MQQLNTANRRAIQRAASNNLRRQGGWSLIEIGAVIAIVIFLVVVNYPSIKGYFIQGRVPAAAGELQRFMSTARIMGEGDTATPYASINNAQNLAPSMRDSTVFKVTGSTVAHRLGGTGVGSNGTITIAPAALGGGASG
ncbi:pilus assembly FimT family protein, partial [Achromobacter spanius]|nr:hypothetical protein [Achromobacter spanius]